jgi:hypothetical protein
LIEVGWRDDAVGQEEIGARPEEDVLQPLRRRGTERELVRVDDAGHIDLDLVRKLLPFNIERLWLIPSLEMSAHDRAHERGEWFGLRDGGDQVEHVKRARCQRVERCASLLAIGKVVVGTGSAERHLQDYLVMMRVVPRVPLSV